MNRFYFLCSFVYRGINNSLGWEDKDYIVVAQNKKDAYKILWNFERRVGALQRIIKSCDYKDYVKWGSGYSKILK